MGERCHPGVGPVQALITDECANRCNESQVRPHASPDAPHQMPAGFVPLPLQAGRVDGLWCTMHALVSSRRLAAIVLSYYDTNTQTSTVSFIRR